MCFVGLSAAHRARLGEAVADPRIGRTYDLRDEADAHRPAFPDARDAAASSRIDMAAVVDDDTLVGVFSLERDRLSYFVMPAHWRRGYGTRIVEGAVALAFETLGFPSLEAIVVRDNVASIRILEANGFELRGVEASGAVRTARERTSLRYTLEAGAYIDASAAR